MSGLVLSSSSVATYLDCHLQWWFAYVVRDPGKPREQTLVGIATHDLVESLLTDPKSLRRQPGHVWDEAYRLLPVFEAEVLPQLGTVRYVEQVYQFEIEGFYYQSYLDYVDGSNRVRDLKTTSRRPGPHDERYRVPMIGHALGFRSLTGEIEADVILDYLVRTKTPYYWPIASGGPVSEDDEEFFIATLEGVTKGIAARDYDPTGLGSPWACLSCPYQDQCGPYQRSKEIAG